MKLLFIEPSPPGWAEAVLRLLLTPTDRESISGDLLEEYRVAKHPALGTLRANAWYGYHGSQRTRLIRTGIVAAGSTSLVGFTTLFAAAAIRTPSLVMGPIANPAYLLLRSEPLSAVEVE